MEADKFYKFHDKFSVCLSFSLKCDFLTFCLGIILHIFFPFKCLREWGKWGGVVHGDEKAQ